MRGLRHEVPHREVKGAGQAQKQAELRVGLASFRVLHCRPMDPSEFSQLLLGEVGIYAGVADAVAQPDAGLCDPWGRCGLHS